MDSTVFLRAQAPMTFMVRATLLFAVFWTSVGGVMGQMFIDGDPVGTLYTEHVGGYWDKESLWISTGMETMT